VKKKESRKMTWEKNYDFFLSQLKIITPTETQENIAQQEQEKIENKIKLQRTTKWKAMPVNPSKGVNERNSDLQITVVYIHYDWAVSFMEQSCVTLIKLTF
jgi:hypothetical protein